MPSDKHTGVDINIGESGADGNPTQVGISWTVHYPARSETEAERAQDGTLDPSWFRGDEVLQTIATEYEGGNVSRPDLHISMNPTENEHGRIVISTSIGIDDAFAGNRSKIEFGSQFIEHLSAGDSLEVVLAPEDWEPETVTTSPDFGRGQKSYFWQIGEDPEPHFVLNESATQEDNDALGSGPIVAVVAFALLAALLAIRARRRDG